MTNNGKYINSGINGFLGWARLLWQGRLVRWWAFGSIFLSMVCITALLGEVHDLGLGTRLKANTRTTRDSTKLQAGFTAEERAETSPRLGIIVPYRASNGPADNGRKLDREAHLFVFSKYMNTFLNDAKRKFEIIVVEQEEGALFNRGALFNVGFNLTRDRFDYVCFHDIDLLPVVAANVYDIPERPTHYSYLVSQFDWKPPYDSIVGGVLCMKSQHYEMVNGMSNKFWGWGGEDDDLSKRLSRNFGPTLHLPERLGRYLSLSHNRAVGQTASQHNLEYLRSQGKYQHVDGLNSLAFAVNSVERSPLGYMKYTVGLRFRWMPTSRDEQPPEGEY